MKKKRIKINVTQRDIDAAIEDIKFGKDICSVCPVARAAQRHKGFETISVSFTCIRQWQHPATSHKGRVLWEVALPEILLNFIVAFDYREAIGIPAPVHAYVEVPECLLS